MWWIYFDLPTEQLVERARRDFDLGRRGAFMWGYGHYFVFAAAAAVGAGLAVAVDQATGHSDLTDSQAGLAVTVPVSVPARGLAAARAVQSVDSVAQPWRSGCNRA